MTTLQPQQPNTQTRAYNVQHTRHSPVKITGKGDDPLWAKAISLTDFNYPWEKSLAPGTTFKALHDQEWLYILYVVEDPNVNVFVDKNAKEEVIYSDRVEIFLRVNELMDPYYALEIDAYGRVMDYQASFHRKFDPSWSWPSAQLIVKSHVDSEGYIVEFAISKKSLYDLELLKDGNIEAGLFRANCTLLTGKDDTMKWISWLTPDAPTPDFHIPSAFGLLSLQE